MQRPTRAIAREAENYFISMTDMMVGILFVFIIMLMAFALNLKQTEDSAEKTINELSGNFEARKNILENIEKAMLEEGIKITIEIENGILRLPEEILFDSGKANIKRKGVVALEKLHDAFVKILPCYTFGHSLEKDNCSNEGENYIDTIFIEGHTDDIPIYTSQFRGNWELSTARAISTFKELNSYEPHIDTILNPNKKPILAVSGYSDTRSVVENTNSLKRRKNRRIDLRFLMSTPSQEKVREVKNKLEEIY